VPTRQQGGAGWLHPLDLTLLGSHAIKFLLLFSYFIHQIEANRPALARTYERFMTLDMHVKSSMKHWAQDELTQGSCSPALRAWERRLDNQHCKLEVPLLSSVHTAAYLLDPLFCSVQGGVAKAPKVPMAHEELIERVGGPAACRQFVTLMSESWTGALNQPVGACAPQRETAQSMGKRQRPQVASIAQRKGMWTRYGVEVHGALAKVALRWLSMHTTSAATERNGALSGRVYGARQMHWVGSEPRSSSRFASTAVQKLLALMALGCC
jgi:hypothetical protein